MLQMGESRCAASALTVIVPWIRHARKRSRSAQRTRQRFAASANLGSISTRTRTLASALRMLRTAKTIPMINWLVRPVPPSSNFLMIRSATRLSLSAQLSPRINAPHATTTTIGLRQNACRTFQTAKPISLSTPTPRTARHALPVSLQTPMAVSKSSTIALITQLLPTQTQASARSVLRAITLEVQVKHVTRMSPTAKRILQRGTLAVLAYQGST
jgi:hypothetical protein